MNKVHRINNYDFMERVGAVKEGYLVEFTYKEWEDLTLPCLTVIDDFDESVIVKQEFSTSDWEDLFK